MPSSYLSLYGSPLSTFSTVSIPQSLIVVQIKKIQLLIESQNEQAREREVDGRRERLMVEEREVDGRRERG